MSSKFLTNVASATLLLAMRVAGQQDGPQVVASVDVGSMVRARPIPAGVSVTPPLFVAIARTEPAAAQRGLRESTGAVAVDHDLLAQLVKDAAPGVEVKFDGPRFWISGPDAAVKAATARLAVLRGAIGAEVRIRIALVGRAPAKSVLTAAETAAFLAEVPHVFTAESVGNSDSPFSLRAGRVQPFVADYSVEVAQKSAIATPIIGHLQLGLSATVAAYALPGGGLLARIGGVYSEASETMRTFPAGDPLRFGDIQTPEPVTSGVSGAAVIESGGSFIAGGTAAGGVWLVQATRGAEPSGDDLQPVAGLIRGRFMLPGLDSGVQGEPYEGLFDADDDWEESSPIAPEHLLALCAAGFPDGEVGLTMTQGGLLVVKGADPAKEKVKRFLPELVRTLLRTCSVEVRFGVVDAAKAAKLAAGTTDAALLPSGRMFATGLAGERFRIFQCTGNSFVASTEPEIAQEASILDPLVRVRFQGVVFEGTIDRDDAGLVGVSGRFSRRGDAGPAAASPRLSNGTVLELPCSESCDLRSTVAPAAKGVWKSFGSTTVKDGVFVVMVRGEG